MKNSIVNEDDVKIISKQISDRIMELKRKRAAAQQAAAANQLKEAANQPVVNHPPVPAQATSMGVQQQQQPPRVVPPQSAAPVGAQIAASGHVAATNAHPVVGVQPIPTDFNSGLGILLLDRLYFINIICFVVEAK